MEDDDEPRGNVFRNEKLLTKHVPRPTIVLDNLEKRVNCLCVPQHVLTHLRPAPVQDRRGFETPALEQERGRVNFHASLAHEVGRLVVENLALHSFRYTGTQHNTLNSSLCPIPRPRSTSGARPASAWRTAGNPRPYRRGFFSYKVVREQHRIALRE